VHATAVVLEGLARRRDTTTLAAPLARWLLDARHDSHWSNTHENAMGLEALSAYYRAFESEVPNMTATVVVGGTPLGRASFVGRTANARDLSLPMPALAAASSAAPPTLSIARAGSGTLYYTARVQTYAPQPPDAQDRGYAVQRQYARYSNGKSAAPATAFKAGDVVRVTVTLTLRGEGRYVALTDPLPAGFEAIEDWNATAESRLAEHATGDDQNGYWGQAGFDHIEKHDDRVLAFATLLDPGRHTLSYLARATTSGTFSVPGATAEAMYAPELSGRSTATTIVVK
jgi:uncharacterized protein YfaS (alpha-2-macroglobulin family)